MAVRLILARNGCAFLHHRRDFVLVRFIRSFSVPSITEAHAIALRDAASNKWAVIEINVTETDLPILVATVFHGKLVLPIHMHPSLDIAFPFFNPILNTHPNTCFNFSGGYEQYLLRAASTDHLLEFRVPHVIHIDDHVVAEFFAFPTECILYLSIHGFVVVDPSDDTVLFAYASDYFNITETVRHAYVEISRINRSLKLPTHINISAIHTTHTDIPPNEVDGTITILPTTPPILAAITKKDFVFDPSRTNRFLSLPAATTEFENLVD